MTIDEKIAEYKNAAHEANDKMLEYSNAVSKAYEKMNVLIQRKYIPLVGKAFRGKDWMVDGFDGTLSPPAKPFFVYGLPPIGWNRSGMVFNEYQLPILRIEYDNEPYGDKAPILTIDTLLTHAFEAEDVYAEFTKDYEEIPIEEFQGYVDEIFSKFIKEVQRDASNLAEGDE